MAHPRSEVGARTVVAVSADAGRFRDTEALLAAIVGVATGMGKRVSATVAETAADLADAVEEAAGGRLVLAGEDLLREALNRALGPLEVGVIPIAGPGALTRALALPRDVPRAARRAFSGEPRPVDVLQVETPERVFLGLEGVSAGLQADAHMRRAFDPGRVLAGASPLISALERYEPWRLELEIDGRPAYDGDAAELFLANFPLFAYGFRVESGTDIADGRFEAVLLRADTRARVARLVLAAYRGSLGAQSNVMTLTGREATLRSEVPLVCDSAPPGITTASVRVLQGRLTIA